MNPHDALYMMALAATLDDCTRLPMRNTDGQEVILMTARYADTLAGQLRDMARRINET